MSYAQDMMNRRGLTRCPRCPGRYPVIGSDGPLNAPILCVGERPGREENSRGRPFVGRSGKEFNEHYLPVAGLTRDQIRITNVIHCYGEEDSGSKEFAEIKQSCMMHHLVTELREQCPKLIVPMGGVAVSAFDDLNLEMHHGIPQQRELFRHSYTVFPVYHPAGGMHKPDLMIPLRRDFIDLGKYLRGELPVPVDEYPDPVYEVLETKNDISGVLSVYPGLDVDCAVDTETDPEEGFWCLTFSLESGTGWMVRKENELGIQVFREWINDTRGKVIFHNGMFDIPVLGQVGIHVPPGRFDDTMVRAYHLQYLPQGLKMLAFRLCGMVMEEFEDIVLPYAVEVMADFILRLAGADWPKPDEQLRIDPKTGEYKLYRPQGLNTKLKRLLTDFSKNPSHKVFKRWEEWSDDEKLPAIQQFGFMPKPSIKYVPIEKAKIYACRDADSTLRVRDKLKVLKAQFRRAA